MSSARVNPVSPPWQFANAKIGPFSLGDFALADKWLSTSIAVPQARIGHCQFYNISNCSRVVIVITISQCITPSKAPFGDYSCVGYNTVTLNEKWTILGVNFTGIDGNAMDLTTAVPYVAGMTKGANINEADQIQIQDGKGGYAIYYMSNGKNAKGATVANLEGKWAKTMTYTPTTDKIANGTAFWYCRTMMKDGDAPLALTVAGAVSTLASSDKEIKETWVHIANPYPADLPLNNGIPYAEGMTKGANINEADQVQIQDGKGGYSIYYMSNGKNAKGATVANLEGKWAKTMTYTPTTDSLPAGKGAWFCRKGTGTITITVQNPIQ